MKILIIFWRVGMKIKEIVEAGTGKIVKGVNTSPDVDTNAIKKQAKKFGFDVDKNGYPKNKLRGKNGRK